MSVIRTSMLVLAIAVMLPSPPEDRKAGTDRSANGPQLVQSAIHAMSDLGVLCSGEGGVCVTAEYLLGRIEAKARFNLNLLYAWASANRGEAEFSPLANQASADPLITGSATRMAAGKADASQNTLRIDDLIPSWRGPRGSNRG